MPTPDELREMGLRKTAVFVQEFVPPTGLRLHKSAFQGIAENAVDELLARIERLCVCGTCGHSGPHAYGDALWCWADTNDPTEGVYHTDSCHFTPSRWTPYWDPEQKAADAPR